MRYRILKCIARLLGIQLAVDFAAVVETNKPARNRTF